MKTAFSKFALMVLAYLIPTMILGMVWHFVWFSELYDKLGIYNRKDPIIPLGFTSMFFQGVIIAYLYPYYAQHEHSIRRSLGFSLIMGFFLFTVSTLANAAKIEVSSMSDWLLVQSLFTLIQFTVVGLLIGLVLKQK
ncbi:hypothetical protein [Dawidia soli]|uniref:DUF1761 domain-containing protein n=1 Tax=Dawidia soli TaxID=2782352 RepID=A0AAP2DDQ4_9BACT|nr:hypothetical protein [Dawidia soli]MBT1689799.1 hypothetical protein [Dawidia soli]